MPNDLKIIKKKYGEDMMHFCRDAFATILEEPGVLSDLVLTYFEPSKELFVDLLKNNLENDFKAFIYHKFNKEEPLTINENKTPQELLSSLGYDLYECHTEADIQSFKKYYAPGEELCTFNGGRLNQCHVFFAVKKDVDNIKREDFPNPERQDLYGTSVISIQFDRDEAHTLSIKNRYNHTANNPDATFSNNLDYIVEGLTDSFAMHYGLLQKNINMLEIPSYVVDNQGKYYKYNYELNNIYYGTNNTIIDNFKPIKFPKDRYILADYFLIDRQEKTIKCYDKKYTDCFPEFFQDNPISKIDLEIKNDIKIVKIETTKGIVTLELDKENKIIGLANPYIEEIGDDFLNYNIYLSKLELSNVKIIGDFFLEFNRHLKELNLPIVREIGEKFLKINTSLKEINLPKVEIIDDDFLYNNVSLSSIYLPQVKIIGDNFLYYNQNLKEIDFPKVEIIKDGFLEYNKVLSKIELPLVKIIGNDFLYYNQNLKEIDLLKVEIIKDGFLYDNEVLSKIELPLVKIISRSFLHNNQNLKEIDLPQVETIGPWFLNNNEVLTKINMPNVKKIQDDFLYYNTTLENIYLPKVEIIGDYFLRHNNSLKKFYMPNIIQIGDDFCYYAVNLEDVVINSEEVYQEFLRQHSEYNHYYSLTRKKNSN